MKKKIFVSLCVATSLLTAVPVFAETDSEILFRDIPYGTSYTDVDEAMGDFNLMDMAGEDFSVMTVDDIVLGDYQSMFEFDYTDINIIGYALSNNVDVAGYTPEETRVFCAFTPVDGILTRSNDDSALYGGQYQFIPADREQMTADLKGKLSALYGEPDKETSDTDLLGNRSEYTFWYGANDTEVVLKSTAAPDTSDIFEDKVCVSYAWLKGDELLQTAADISATDATSQEAGVYGNNSTNGL